MPASPDITSLLIRARHVADAIAARNTPDLRRVAAQALDIIRREMHGTRYNAVPNSLIALGNEYPALPRLVLAMLVADTNIGIISQWPDTVRTELIRQDYRIIASCEDTATTLSFDHDVVQKDLGIARLELYPFRARVVERSSGVPLRLLLTGALPSAISLGIVLLMQGGRRPYYEVHTHTPMLDGFNVEGWTACFEMTADMMEVQQYVKGVIGISWFYDPAIASISPHLAYLHALPLSGGAYLLRCKSSAKDVALATATSATRRTLFESGKYTPTSHAFIWQRKDLLRWRRGGTR